VPETVTVELGVGAAGAAGAGDIGARGIGDPLHDQASVPATSISFNLVMAGPGPAQARTPNPVIIGGVDEAVNQGGRTVEVERLDLTELQPVPLCGLLANATDAGMGLCGCLRELTSVYGDS